MDNKYDPFFNSSSENKEPVNDINKNDLNEPKHEMPEIKGISDFNEKEKNSFNNLNSETINPTQKTAIKKASFSPIKKEKSQLKFKTIISVVLICALVSLVFGAAGGYLSNKYLKSGASIVFKTAENSDSNSSASVDAGSGKTIAQVTDAVANSVVEITTESVRTGNYINQYVTEGAGSGVIISADGYIITNNHVISNASKINVRTKAGQTYTASLKGTDSTSDIALLKIDANDLSPVTIGDSSNLKVGDMAIAIGNPLGQLGGTVTTGIISALDREITINGTKMNLLQTDAAINPGNSGGGLFNSNGELIGIVSAKSSGESIEGLGFAIPVNDITNVIKDISEFGYVKGRPQLGVSLVDVKDSQAAWQYGVSKLGVYVYSVNDGSGAAQAGVKSGDLIQAIDNKSVSTTSDVKGIIQQHNVGDTVTLSIVRDNMQQDISVTLTESTANNNNSQAQK